MLYHIFSYLDKVFDFPGAGMFNYISFRAAMALIFAMIIGLFIGKKIIRILQRKQIGEEIRDLGLEGQMQKRGTPTMGGIIILLSILIPILIFGKLDNVYLLLMITATVWLGLLGFIDDYIKVFKKNKKGLSGISKLVGQTALGLVVGCTLYFSEDVVVREKVSAGTPGAQVTVVEQGQKIWTTESKTTQTTIPFFKYNEFDYNMLMPGSGKTKQNGGWIIFVAAVVIIIASISNGANLTDGMDGLATGISIIIGTTLGIFAYLSGNIIYADYLNIMYIPSSGELVVYMAAFIGGLVGFLWYNSYPAQVFMGDTGSLALGGIIAVFAIIIRKELLTPILCGIFLVESVSVIAQVSYFKFTKRKTGVGKRIFKMTPLHHHYQKEGYAGIDALIQKPAKPLPESKIVVRFWIIAVLLAVITVVTLKIR
ncbi:MAG: phospho-N-acetylmuramoyl-pentapeptide-transferase [Prevotellaceae bacterium]|jgi:phospho-N-acetylmuramoyl-pentapeptide-transferase|nr:phospho-N-acetylmuramoyl-pentapeptide-transferase [Prevotellaceae bacterium]